MQTLIIKKIIYTLFFICLFNFVNNIVYSDESIVTNESLDKRSQKLYKEIRCLVCQNQSIEDSNAGLAKQIKLIIRELILKGYTDKEVRSYLVDRYGNWVLLKPPFNLSTAALWLLPFLILLLAILAGLIYISKKSRNQNNQSVPLLEQDEQKKLKKILDEF